MNRLLVALMTTAVLSGCTLYGHPIPMSSVDAIQPNVTTQEQIYAKFGVPVRTGTDSGFVTWRYTFRGFDDNAEWLDRDLYIIFNKNKTVQKFSFSTNKSTVEKSGR